ncbi:MAG: PfkB family carbohydrate kinase [Patescibacteria group bacterium]|nr:PfkB family carbohydrate kinase [Patescibacteria group bacterium]
MKTAREFLGIPDNQSYEVLLAPSVCIEETKQGPISGKFSKIPVTLKRRVSGTSLNIALALTRVFEKSVKLLGCVSDNAYEPHNAYLQTHVSNLGLDFHPLPVYNDTSVATLIIDTGPEKSEDNLMLSTKGKLIKPEIAAKEIRKQIQLCRPDIIMATGVTDNDYPMVKVLFEKEESFRILNPRPELLRQISLDKIKGIDLLIINHEELSGCLGQEIKANEIKPKDVLPCHNLGIPFIIVTLNHHGMIFSGSELNFFRPAINLGQAISSTGTGDAFTSAFIAAVLEGLDLETCLLWARVFAGLKVIRTGGSNIPTAKEFRVALEKI